jgi:hypothetical protein
LPSYLETKSIVVDEVTNETHFQNARRGLALVTGAAQGIGQAIALAQSKNLKGVEEYLI